MLKRILIIAAVLIAGAWLSAPKAHAEQTIAIVDVERILGEAKAAKSLQQQIQAKKESFQKEFAAKEKELKTTETTLLSEQGKLSAEEFNKKRKAYEEKIIEARKLFEKRRNGLQKGVDKAMVELRKDIMEVTAAVASAKNYDMVLTRDSVVIAEKAMDITSDVLKGIDAKVTNVPLTVE